jgi:hypothetical protein
MNTLSDVVSGLLRAIPSIAAHLARRRLRLPTFHHQTVADAALVALLREGDGKRERRVDGLTELISFHRRELCHSKTELPVDWKVPCPVS